MTHLFLGIDTETTGLPLWNDPSEDPRQPHLVQLALVMVNEARRELARVNVMVRPDGWTIPPEVTAIHGIDDATALACGIPEKSAALLYGRLAERADILIGHNVGFDLRIMRIALVRAGYAKETADALHARPKFDTCLEATNVVQAPPTERMLAKGMKGFKKPNLGEAMRAIFGEEMTEAHNAAADLDAAMRLFWHLRHD